MKKRFGLFIVGLCAVIMWSIQPAWAQTTVSEKDEDAAAAGMDRDASSPEGAQKVTQRLAQEFNVDASRITSLREHKLGYGEIDHALSIAQRMPGGITDENVNQIMALRQDHHMGWGNISKQLLGTKLGQTVMQGHVATTTTEPQSTIHPGQATATEQTSRGLSLHPGSSAGGFGGSSPFGGTSGGGYPGKSGKAPGHNR